MKVIRTYWDKDFGFGDVVVETEHFIVVNFYSDPWTYHQIPKEETEKEEM